MQRISIDQSHASGASFRRAVTTDIASIMDLAEANFVANLSVEDRRDGFLSARFTAEQLAEMADDIGIMVAVDGQGRVLGFLCATQGEFNLRVPLLAEMLRQFDRVQYQGERLSSYKSFVYGPVCIDRSMRSRGLLRGLYYALIKEVTGRYDLGVAFVAKENPHSMRAHTEGLGMTAVGDFDFNNHAYVILAFAVG